MGALFAFERTKVSIVSFFEEDLFFFKHASIKALIKKEGRIVKEIAKQFHIKFPNIQSFDHIPRLIC